VKRLLHAFALCAALAIAPQALAQSATPIEPDAVLARSAKQDTSLVIVDVRSPAEFAEGHVPGARNIPHDQLAARLAELRDAKDKDIVLYCRSGRRVELATETLRGAGFEKLLHLKGDMQQWLEAGHPLAK